MRCKTGAGASSSHTLGPARSTEKPRREASGASGAASGPRKDTPAQRRRTAAAARTATSPGATEHAAPSPVAAATAASPAANHCSRVAAPNDAHCGALRRESGPTRSCELHTVGSPPRRSAPHGPRAALSCPPLQQLCAHELHSESEAVACACRLPRLPGRTLRPATPPARCPGRPHRTSQTADALSAAHTRPSARPRLRR